jgi:hypothetical protein
MLSVNYAECHYAECHYAECLYAECHYAECVVAPVNALKRENVLTLTLSLKFGGKNCQNFTKNKFFEKSFQMFNSTGKQYSSNCKYLQPKCSQ